MDTKADIIDCDPVSTSASLSNSYRFEWENLFIRQDARKRLKKKALEGNLRSSRFRSVAWKIFLEVLSSDVSGWIRSTEKSRYKYEEMKNRLIVNPRKAVDSVDITLNNPLSQAEESPWNRFFQDNELRLTIKQDVIRTYPKIEFFQSNQLRNLMVDILFIFAKENADISYQQGMHELLAPLIFVLHCDHQAFLHACEIDPTLCSHENMMKEVLDPTFLEHDAYTMFCQVMKTVEPWYLSRDLFNMQTKTGSTKGLNLINVTPFSKSQDLNPSSLIAAKLTRIQDVILKKYDPDLHLHLERLDIVPQIYGIRWLRLIFGREFPMQDLLMLWDAVFGDGISFDLVDYIFVAMLLYLRDVLLTNDYTVCLTALMKFPPVADVHYFVAKALWLREPNVYPQPPSYTHQGSIRISSSMDSSPENSHSFASDGGDRDIGRSQHSGHKRSNNMLSGFSSFSRKFSRPRTLSVPKSSSEPMNLQTDVSPDMIGSTVSLSHVEESMFRHNPLACSLTQLEGSNLRSAQSSPGVHQSAMFPLTPDDLSITSSPPKYNSLLGKSRTQQMTSTEQELREKISRLQGELNEKNSMCRYCSSKLDVHIGRLQQDLSKQNSPVDQDIMLSLAGLKLVRDILNGTVMFSLIAASDGDSQITDEYGSHNEAGDNCSTGVTSPESDILMSAPPCEGNELRPSEILKPKSFYMEVADVNSPHLPEPHSGRFDGRIRKNNAEEPHHCQNLDESKVKSDSNIGNIYPRNSLIERNRPSDRHDTTKDQGQTNSSNFTSKFFRMFKTDPSPVQKSRPSVPTKSPQQKFTGDSGMPAPSSKHFENRPSSLSISQEDFAVGAATAAISQPQSTKEEQLLSQQRYSKDEQLGRELKPVDSKWRAKHYSQSDWVHFSSNQHE